MDEPGHPRFHVIEQVAVEKPVAGFIGIKLKDGGGHWCDINRMLQGSMITLAVQYPEEVTVEVHRVVHHGPVDHDETDYFPFPDQDMVGLGEWLVVQ